jgi:hypothetical protein
MACAGHLRQAEKIGAISMDHFIPDSRTGYHRECFSPLSARFIVISQRINKVCSDPQQRFGAFLEKGHGNRCRNDRHRSTPF